MSAFKSAVTYFAVVFAVGFVLGSIRVSILVPNVGERAAELLEAPFMLVAILLAARWVGRRFVGPARGLLTVGLLAAMLVLGADLVVGVAVRGMSAADVLFERDSVAGTVYYLLLGLFACMPWLWGRGTRASSPTLGSGSGE